MNQGKSIFDGWTNQAFGIQYAEDGGNCALGWMNRCDQRQRWDAVPRLAQWIRANLDPPRSYVHPTGMRIPITTDEGFIAWANNERKLDPDGFRFIDLLTQGYVPESPDTPQPVEVGVHG